MTTALTFFILIAPFAVAAPISWAAHRSDCMRFGASGQLMNRLLNFEQTAERDPEAVRTRFEQNPVWPVSDATGERR